MSRGHYLKPNDNTETIHSAIFFDTETDPIQISPLETGHKLRQGWAAHVTWRKSSGWSKPDWFRFEQIPEFWRWVEGKARAKTKTYIFCHNSGFDYPVVDAFGYLPAHGWVPRKLVAEGPPTIIEVRKNGRTLALLDTLNWWRIPLARLGQSLGLPKLAFPRSDEPTSVWDRYNRRDVQILIAAIQAWCDFLRDHDFGGFASTLAGQSMRTYRHRFMRHRILIDGHTNALACSRAAYHGGRVEAFYIGRERGRYHLLDVNSMFPAMMRDHRFPAVYKHYWRLTTPAILKRMIRRFLICARVNVTVSEPALPYRTKERLIFPTGTFETSLSTPELQWVLEHGRINHVHEMTLYTGQPLFKEFIEELYALRLAARNRGDEVNAWLFKILMNSLYGKWGQRGYVYEEVGTTPLLDPAVWQEIDIDTGIVRKYKRIMGVIMEQQREDESAGSHPAIAAHVTAHARMHLWQLIQEAGRDNVYYCDTDSLLVNDIGLDRLAHHLSPDVLGGLKLEGTFEDIEIYGAKDYRFGPIKKTKGVRRGAKWIAPNWVEQEKWSGLRGLIRAGNLTTPVTSLIRKRLDRTYKKGVVQADGWVKAHHL